MISCDMDYFLNQACNFAYDRQQHFFVFTFFFITIFPFLKSFEKWSLGKSCWVMASGIILLHLDSIILGPLGPRDWGDDGRAWIGFMPYLAKNKELFQNPFLWKLFRYTIHRHMPFRREYIVFSNISF